MFSFQDIKNWNCQFSLAPFHFISMFRPGGTVRREKNSFKNHLCFRVSIQFHLETSFKMKLTVKARHVKEQHRNRVGNKWRRLVRSSLILLFIFCRSFIWWPASSSFLHFHFAFSPPDELHLFSFSSIISSIRGQYYRYNRELIWTEVLNSCTWYHLHKEQSLCQQLFRISKMNCWSREGQWSKWRNERGAAAGNITKMESYRLRV